MVRPTPAVILGMAALVVLSFPLHGQEPSTPDYELEELVVTATPIPLPLSALGSHVTLLDGEELRARGMVRVLDALREVPGLAVARNGSFGAVASVFFRGAESDHTLVLVDGVQVNQPGGAFDFSGLDMASVERIEVVRGPSSALHGSDAVAGVIHVITRRGGRGPRAALTGHAGSFGRLDGTLALTGGSDAVAWGITVGRQSTDGILEFNNAHENSVVNGRVEVQVDEASHVRLSARATDRTYRFPTDPSGAVVDRNQFTFGTEALVGLEMDRRLTPALSVRSMVSVFDAETGTDDAPDSPADTLGFYGFQSLDALTRTQADLRLNWTAGPRTTVTAGGEYERQQVRSFNESLSQFGPSTGRSAHRRSNRAGYGHLVTGVGKLDANAGFRVEGNEQFGTFLTWQLGASVAAGDHTRLRGSLGRGIKEPTFFEAFATGFTRGNPELEPERSTSWEAGVEQGLLDGRVQLQVTGFNQDIRDLIQYTGSPPNPGDPNYFNIAEARARGVELGAQVTPVGGLTLSTELTLLDTEVVDAGFDEGPGATFVRGERLLRRPESQLRVAAGWSGAGRLRADVSLLRVAERSDRDFTTFPASPVTLPAYTLLDASVQLRLREPGAGRPGVSVFLRGENLLDEDYQEVFGFRMPGRGVSVGGRVSLGG